MAGKDESRSVFDYTRDELGKVSTGQPVSASHTNKIVDAINRGQKGVPSAEQIVIARSGSSIDLGIIRGWPVPQEGVTPVPLKDILDVSMIVRDSATGKWSIPEKATVEVVCSPGLQATDYESVKWVGPDGLNYPLEIPRQITVLAQPIVSVGSSLVALWLPSLVVADPLPDNLDVSDGSVKDGASEVSFAITA